MTTKAAVTNKPYRRNKRQEYINELEHDLNYFTEGLKELKEKIVPGTPIFFWWHGEKIFISRAQREIKEITEELRKLAADKNYKPYIGLDY
jgi:hypothetical protein